MNKFIINEDQLDRLKGLAVSLRADPVPDDAALADTSYSIEAIIGEVETTPAPPSDEDTYGEQSNDDDDESSSGSEEDL
jgi:hypothetical protein